jgi:hypothetical protein
MEYKSSTGHWTNVSGAEITGLTAVSNQIRVQAKAASFKSADQIITLTDPGAAQESHACHLD